MAPNPRSGMQGKLNIFDILSKRLDWLNQRQRVLADNIANSDTPKYVPRDLNESHFRSVLRTELTPVVPQTTHASHMRGTVARDGPARVERQNGAWETSPSGNAVILDEQLIKIAKTQSDHQLISNLYRKHMDMIILALRGTRG